MSASKEDILVHRICACAHIDHSTKFVEQAQEALGGKSQRTLVESGIRPGNARGVGKLRSTVVESSSYDTQLRALTEGGVFTVTHDNTVPPHTPHSPHSLPLPTHRPVL